MLSRGKLGGSTSQFDAPIRDERLVERGALHRQIRGYHSVLIVSAPGGFGKTVVLGAWAREFGAAFVTLRREHQDVRLLVPLIVAALASALAPQNSELSERLSQLSHAGPAVETAESIGSLLQFSGAKIALAIDDVQHLAGSGDSSAFLDRLIEAFLDSGMRLAMAGRALPKLRSLAKLQAGPALLELGAGDLAFTESEIGEAMNRMFGVDVSSKLRADVFERTRGWAALVALAGRWLANRPAEAREAAVVELSGNERTIYEYLATEILDDRAEMHRQFLLSASLADRIPAGLVDQLLPGAGLDIMRDLEFGRFVLRTETPKGALYDFHPLLAEFLSTRAQQELGAIYISRLHKTFADWFARNGMWNAAFKHWMDAGMQDRIVGQMLRWEMSFEEWWTEYGRWLKIVDAQAIDNAPRLMLRHAMMSANLGDVGEALDWLERADRAAKRLEHAESIVDVRTARAIVLFFANFPAESKEMCDALEPDIDSMTPFQRSTLATALVLLHNNDYIDPERALKFLDIYEETVNRAGYQRGAFIATANRAVASRIIGDFEQQIGVLDRLRAAKPDRPVPLIYEALLRFSEALAISELGLPEGPSAMEGAIELLDRLGAKGQIEYGKKVLRLVQCEYGDASAVEDVDVWSSGNSPYKEESQVFQTLGDARAHARSGDHQSAIRESNQAIDGAKNDYLKGVALLESARTAAMANDVGRAVEWARMSLKIAEDVKMRATAARCRILLCALDATSDRKRIADCLNDAREPMYDRFLLYRERRWAATALNRALAMNVEPEAASRLLVELGEQPIRVYGYGGMRLFVGDREVAADDWERPQAKAVFAYLALNAGRPIHAEAIIDQFWPDADGRSAKANLKTAIARIRKALQSVGAPNLVAVNDEMYRLDLPESSWCDWTAFEAMAHSANDPGLAPDAKVDVGWSALQIAREEFLPEYRYEDWAAIERERQGLLVQSLLASLGEGLLEIGRFEEAKTIGERMLSFDPLDESGAKALIAALRALDRTEEAKRAFRAYEKRLVEELGLLPSDELADLVR